MSDEKKDASEEDAVPPNAETGTEGETTSAAARPDDEAVDAEIVSEDQPTDQPREDVHQTAADDTQHTDTAHDSEPATTKQKKSGGVVSYVALGAVTAAIVAGIVIVADNQDADPIASTDGIIIADAEREEVLFPLADNRAPAETGVAEPVADAPEMQLAEAQLAQNTAQAGDTDADEQPTEDETPSDEPEAAALVAQDQPAETEEAGTGDDSTARADALIAALNERAAQRGNEQAEENDEPGAEPETVVAEAEEEPVTAPAAEEETASAASSEDDDEAAAARVESLRQLALRRAEERRVEAERRATAEDEPAEVNAAQDTQPAEPETQPQPQTVDTPAVADQSSDEPVADTETQTAQPAAIPDERIETLRREIVEDVSTIVRDVSNDVRQGVKSEVLAETEERIDNRFAETEEALVETERRLAELQSSLNTQQREAQQQLSQLDSRIEELRMRDVAVAQRGALLVALTELSDSIDNGRPFRRQLNTVRSITGERDQLSALEPFADRGLPTEDTLKTRFDIAARQALTGEKKANAETVFERFGANLAALFTVRPVGEVEGENTGAIIARAEQDLDQGDISGALRELDDLEGAAAEAFSEWIAAAEVRAAADQGLRRLEQQVVKPQRG
ncbi:MAG: mitofilin family membrane protein [Parvularcula sp.]|jgi:hypothetical protein|nr:mitofilin family membrane protein [Parvularcula sp.]